MRLQGKTVLITGASKGIGRELALGCAREGADVIVNYHTDRRGADAVVAEVEAIGRKSVSIAADVGKPAQIEALFSEARGWFPQLDVLVNNAGLTGWTPLFETREADWDQVMSTNLKGTFFCSLAAAKWMRDQRVPGSIINVSTNCAALGVRNLVAYAASKAGIHGLTRQLAVELASYRIRVNTFAPGPTNVDRNLADDPDYAAMWGKVVPLGRTADPSEMVGACIFLASQESSYMTGQVFYVDGGWTVQGVIPQDNLEKAADKHRDSRQH